MARDGALRKRRSSPIVQGFKQDQNRTRVRQENVGDSFILGTQYVYLDKGRISLTMGFRARDWFEREGWKWKQLKGSLFVIMWRASLSCIDNEALLKPWPGDPVRSRYWLAVHANTSVRSLERQEPKLREIEMLAWNGEGYRLPRFYAWDRHSGGILSDTLRKERKVFPTPLSKERKSEEGLETGITRTHETGEVAELQKAYDEAVQRYLEREGVKR